MKQQISPIVVIIALVVVLGVAAFAWMKSGGVENKVGEQPPGMPEHAAKKWAEISSGGPGQSSSSIPSVGGAPSGGTSIPTGPGGGGMPTGPGGSSIPTGPPTGR
jgi:hypothetical protein